MQLARPHVPFLYRIQRMRCVLDYVTEDDVYVSRGSCMYAMYTTYIKWNVAIIIYGLNLEKLLKIDI